MKPFGFFYGHRRSEESKAFGKTGLFILSV